LDYRPDIDGLRAIAILFVLMFHAVPAALPGGFTGVDIFFVISGFLITRMILVDLARHSFSFLAFYGRRIRRLFPALIIVIVAVWLFGWFCLFPQQYASLGRHIVAGAGFASNLLSNAEVGYFDAPASTKPLLHLWSLGVEEQFYILFPAVLFLVAPRPITAAFAVGTIFLVSFAANTSLLPAHPAFVFYSSITRLWEFVIGGALAWYQLRGRDSGLLAGWERSKRVGNTAGTAGLLLLAAGGIFIRESGFPGWWALLPTLGACLIIAAGPGSRINRSILASPALVFIGLISYPLYLWHWPLLVMGRHVLLGQHPKTTAQVAIGLSFLLAWATYAFVERPVRTNRVPAQRRLATLAAAICLAALAVLGLFTAYTDGLPLRYPREIAPLLAARSYGDDFTPTPPLGARNNSSGPLVITWGDSHAGHLHPGLQHLQKERAFRLMMVPWGDCPLTRTVTEERCRIPSPDSMDTLRSLKPDIIILSAFWPQYQDRLNKISTALGFLRAIGTPKTIVVGPVPLWYGSVQMALYDAYKRDPGRRVPERLPEYQAKFFAEDPEHAETMDSVEREVSEIAKRFGVTFVSPRAILCNAQGCLVRIGNTAKDILQVDNSHFGDAGSWFLVNEIARDIFE
jgi:peptidoglycan/LPS O-acetylase OafA/YrhL